MSTNQLGRWARRSVGAILVGAAMLCSVQPALAQSRPQPARHTRTTANAASARAEVEVLVVHANNSGKVDPKLKGLQRQLAFTRFSGFQLLSTHPSTLSSGQVMSVNVEGGRKLKVRLLEQSGNNAKVRIQLYKGSEKKLDTTVSIPRDRTFIVAGPKYQGGALVFPVTIKY